MENKSNILIIEDDVPLNDNDKATSHPTRLLCNFCLLGERGASVDGERHF